MRKQRPRQIKCILELSNWDANILVHFWSLCSSLLCQAASTKKSDLESTWQAKSLVSGNVAWCRIQIQFLINLKFITFLISARYCFRHCKIGMAPVLMPVRLGFWKVISSQLFFHCQATAVHYKLGDVSVLWGRFRGGWGIRASSEAKSRVLEPNLMWLIWLSPQRPHRPLRAAESASTPACTLWGTRSQYFQCLGEKQLAPRGVRNLTDVWVARCQGPQIPRNF